MGEKEKGKGRGKEQKERKAHHTRNLPVFEFGC
jgi:hypothetical protein